MNYKTLLIVILSFLQCKSATPQEKNVFKQNASLGIHWDGLYPDPYAVSVDQNKIKSISMGSIIPRDENAIMALLVDNDNRLFGATSGNASHLFSFDKVNDKLIYLGKIDSDKVVNNAMIISGQGDIFIGTTRWTDPSQVKVQTKFPGGWQQSEEIENQSSYKGGHLYLFKKSNELSGVPLNTPAELIDLGIPVKGEGIYSLTYNLKSNRIYGLTIPSGIAFSYDINTGKYVSFGATTNANYLPPYTFISRSLIAFNGNVYGSGFHGEMFYIKERTGELVKNSGYVLPCLKGREFLCVADELLSTDSVIIGGTSEGYIFSYNPSSGYIRNYGRPYRENRIRGMVKGLDNKLYIIAGEAPDGFCQLFNLDLVSHSFKSLGLIEDIKGNWLGYQFDSMTADNDGVIFMGENCSKSHLFVYDSNLNDDN